MSRPKISSVEEREHEPGSYEDTPHPVAVLRRRVRAAGRTEWHSHRRRQLLYATSGLMIVTTDEAAWMVPIGHALLIPEQVLHEAACTGPIDLCTAYIEPGCVMGGAARCRVVKVSRLLDAALQALAEEQDEGYEGYDPDGRSGALAKIVIDEIERAPDAPLAIPMPTDPRLRRICDALVDNPAIERDLDDWAMEVGLSRRTLTRRFRAEVSLSFAEWRRQLRSASTIIKQSQGQSLQAAATAVGYRTTHGLRAMLARTASRSSAR